MSRVRVGGFSISLDGFGAGPEQSLEHPLGRGGEALHQWMFGTRFFRASNAVFNEIRAKRLSGNIFEFDAVEAGQPFRLFDSVGNLVAVDRGSIHHHAVFDTEGDDIVGAVLIEELEPEVHGPHPGFDDFCGLITPLIGS